MAGKVVTIQFQGRSCRGVEIEVEESTERWCVAKLVDGSVIRLKAVITEILKLEGEFDAEGTPIYMIKSTNITSVASPAHLLRGAGENSLKGVQ